jgi:hypothetical protein
MASDWQQWARNLPFAAALNSYYKVPANGESWSIPDLHAVS